MLLRLQYCMALVFLFSRYISSFAAVWSRHQRFSRDSVLSVWQQPEAAGAPLQRALGPQVCWKYVRFKHALLTWALSNLYLTHKSDQSIQLIKINAHYLLLNVRFFTAKMKWFEYLWLLLKVIKIAYIVVYTFVIPFKYVVYVFVYYVVYRLFLFENFAYWLFVYVVYCLFSFVVRIKDACKLYCRASSSSAYYLLKDKVVDGTKCGPDTFDMCVNGICQVKIRSSG